MNYLILSFVITIVIYLIFKRNKSSKINSIIPGPIGLPIIGSLLSLDKNGIHLTFLKWFNQYGPIYKLRMGSTNVVVLTGYPMIRKAFIENSESFSQHFIFNSRFAINKCGDMTQENGSTHSVLKRQILSEMTATRIKRQETIIQNEIVKLMSQLDKHADQGEPFVLNKYFLIFSLNIILRFTFGIDVPYDQAEDGTGLIAAIREYLIGSGEPILSDFLPFLPQSKNTKFYTANKALVEKIEIIVKKHKDRSDDCILSKLMKEYEKGSISWNSVIANCSLVITAGSDSSSSTTLFCLVEMMNNQNLQSKLYNEISVSVSKNHNEDDTINDMVVLRYSKYRSLLPYLSLTLKENYRKYPAAPFGAPYLSTKDCVLAGYKISKGTMIIQNIWATHRSDTFYYSPDKFIPERFIDTTGFNTSLVSFGCGVRDCPGRSLADNEIFTLMSSLLNRYEFINPNASTLLNETGIPGLTLQCPETIVQIKKRK